MQVAERLREMGADPVVISADSRQVYQHMNIGTSKTTPEQARGVPHRMLSLVEPTRKFELEEYLTAARAVLDDCRERGQLPLIVGGTGVYVAGLLGGWDATGTAKAKAALRRDFPPSMIADAYATLRRLDPARARTIDPRNHDAILNALAQITTRTRDTPDARPAERTIVLGVDRPADLDQRVAATFDDQLRRGLLDEIHDLNDRYDLDTEIRRNGQPSANQVLHTHGYREYFEVAAGLGKSVRDLTSSDRDQVRSQVLATIRAHTRRQRAYFRKLPGLQHVHTTNEALRLITGHGQSQ